MSGDMPRKFKLLEEYENATHGKGDPSCSYGLEAQDDIDMKSWMATIIGPYGTTYDNRIYSLRIITDMDYPQKQPKVQFLTKINITCINQSTGVVDANKLPVLKNWTSKDTIEKVLVGIKQEMLNGQNKKLSQPPEGASF